MVYTLYGTPYTNFIFQMNFVLITGHDPDVQPKFLRNFTERNGTERDGNVYFPSPTEDGTKINGRRNFRRKSKVEISGKTLIWHKLCALTI